MLYPRIDRRQRPGAQQGAPTTVGAAAQHNTRMPGGGYPAVPQPGVVAAEDILGQRDYRRPLGLPGVGYQAAPPAGPPVTRRYTGPGAELQPPPEPAPRPIMGPKRFPAPGAAPAEPGALAKVTADAGPVGPMGPDKPTTLQEAIEAYKRTGVFPEEFRAEAEAMGMTVPDRTMTTDPESGRTYIEDIPIEYDEPPKPEITSYINEPEIGPDIDPDIEADTDDPSMDLQDYTYEPFTDAGKKALESINMILGGHKTADVVNAQNQADKQKAANQYLMMKQAREAAAAAGYGPGTAQYERMMKNVRAGISTANLQAQNQANAVYRQAFQDALDRATGVEQDAVQLAQNQQKFAWERHDTKWYQDNTTTVNNETTAWRFIEGIKNPIGQAKLASILATGGYKSFQDVLKMINANIDAGEDMFKGIAPEIPEQELKFIIDEMQILNINPYTNKPWGQDTGDEEWDGLSEEDARRKAAERSYWENYLADRGPIDATIKDREESERRDEFDLIIKHGGVPDADLITEFAPLYSDARNSLPWGDKAGEFIADNDSGGWINVDGTPLKVIGGHPQSGDDTYTSQDTLIVEDVDGNVYTYTENGYWIAGNHPGVTKNLWQYGDKYKSLKDLIG